MLSAHTRPAFIRSSYVSKLATRASSRIVAPLVLLIAAPVLPAQAQDQQPRSQPGWPCAGTVSPFYIQSAEATGGKVMLFGRGETGGAAADYAASSRHEEAIFRVSAPLDRGSYEFEIPVDSTIESVYFFVSIQCLESVALVRPSGEELRTDGPDVEYHRFDAVRLFTVREPGPGIWKVRVTGRGVFSLIVKAQTELQLSGVAFVDGAAPVKGQPVRGRPQRLEAYMSGHAGEVAFQFVAANTAMLQTVDLGLEKESERYRTYAGQVTPPNEDFRVVATGTDANGFRFQRIEERLFVELK